MRGGLDVKVVGSGLGRGSLSCRKMESNYRNMEMYCVETFTANRRSAQTKVKVSVTLHGADNSCR